MINGDTELPVEEPAPEKVRLDVLMRDIYKSYNRSTLQKFIESGFVKVDGELVTKPNVKFGDGVKIELVVPEKLKNADVKVEVLYEDDDVLVVNKPSGLLSEAKGEYCPEKTLADYGMVAHRLDRDTSGVMILAKNEAALKYLKNQFQRRTVHKTYYAVVEGRPKYDQMRIDLPLIRDKKRPTTFRVDANGKEAETFLRVLKTNDTGVSGVNDIRKSGASGARNLKTDGVRSLVELRPTTGRTHQLRVHMKYLGHPIVGDVVYGDGGADRLYLHAGELEITLPGGERRVFRVARPRSFDVF